MSNLPTWRDAVQLRLINVSAGKAYVPESADLQLELLRQSWEKNPYRTKTWDKFRRESLTAVVLIYTQEVFGGGNIPVSQHCFKSGDTKWISGLFPGNGVYLHQNPLFPEMQKSEGKSEICILLHAFWLKRWIEKALRQQQTPSFQKKLHSKMAEQAGKSPCTNHQWPRPLEGPKKRTYHHPRQLEEHQRNQSPIKAIPFKASLDGSRHYGPVLPLPCQKQARP